MCKIVKTKKIQQKFGNTKQRWRKRFDILINDIFIFKNVFESELQALKNINYKGRYTLILANRKAKYAARKLELGNKLKCKMSDVNCEERILSETILNCPFRGLNIERHKMNIYRYKRNIELNWIWTSLAFPVSSFTHLLSLSFKHRHFVFESVVVCHSFKKTWSNGFSKQ